jgi:hypothetical protein
MAEPVPTLIAVLTLVKHGFGRNTENFCGQESESAIFFDLP